MSDPIISILLLPQHLTPIPSHLDLLTALQQVLNESYGKTYTAISEVFDSPYIRLADPTQFASVIGAKGFTVILVRINTVNENGIKLGEIVATGSAKDFKDGHAEAYLQWSQDLNGTERPSNDFEKRSSKPVSTEASYELAQFAVSPKFQAGGLGTRVLQEIEWILSSGLYGPRLESALVKDALTTGGIELGDSFASFPVEGINLNLLKQAETTVPRALSDEEGLGAEKPKFVLIAIQELGTDGYYIRRGFRRIWSGMVPTGTWHCKKPCTAVYMEKEIK